MISLIVTPSRGSHGQVLALAQHYPETLFYHLSEYYSDRYKADVEAQDNLILIEDIREVLVKIARFDRLITFGASDSPGHRLSFQISMIFHKLGKPRFDVQHGLVLSGYNEIIDGKMSDVTIFADKCIAMSTFGPLLPFRKTFAEKRAEPRHYRIGISSNLHWDVYDGRERSLFFRSVDALCVAFPEFEIVWRPHPAEFAFRGNSREGSFLPFDLKGISRENLKVMSYDDTEAMTSEVFLDGVDALFTSVSTMLLDAEQAGTPCVLLRSRRLARTLDAFERVAVAREPSEVTKMMTRALAGDPEVCFESGFPQRFNRRGFAEAIGLGASVTPSAAPAGHEDQILTAFQIYSELAGRK